ncbi:hypothetical protein DKG34_06645 [Streptomyces sp. NWU49]|nr:hypothetical protein DKG34_06645 [Streptomyces sp. NWU49]
MVAYEDAGAVPGRWTSSATTTRPDRRGAGWRATAARPAFRRLRPGPARGPDSNGPCRRCTRRAALV